MHYLEKAGVPAAYSSLIDYGLNLVRLALLDSVAESPGTGPTEHLGVILVEKLGKGLHGVRGAVTKDIAKMTGVLAQQGVSEKVLSALDTIVMQGKTLRVVYVIEDHGCGLIYYEEDLSVPREALLRDLPENTIRATQGKEGSAADTLPASPQSIIPLQPIAGAYTVPPIDVQEFTKPLFAIPSKRPSRKEDPN